MQKMSKLFMIFDSPFVFRLASKVDEGPPRGIGEIWGLLGILINYHNWIPWKIHCCTEICVSTHK